MAMILTLFDVTKIFVSKPGNDQKKCIEKKKFCISFHRLTMCKQFHSCTGFKGLKNVEEATVVDIKVQLTLEQSQGLGCRSLQS